MKELFIELGKMPPGIISALSILSGAIGGIISCIITIFVGKKLLSARDNQDRESEWRKHAIELTKLDLERLLKSTRDFSTNPLRPCILEFLANYRDLQELDRTSVKELYEKIEAKRVNKRDIII